VASGVMFKPGCASENGVVFPNWYTTSLRFVDDYRSFFRLAAASGIKKVSGCIVFGAINV
jgi:hypothetical protein